MKVMVDTRHDSLEEALATVRAAFGSSGDTPNAGRAPERKFNVGDGNPRPAQRAKSADRVVATPVTKSSPTKSTAARTSGRKGKQRTGSMNQTSNIAPPGQADAIRAWARTQGLEVKQAGRLPASVIQAYQE